MALRIQGLMLWLPPISTSYPWLLHDLLMTYMRNVSSSNFGRNWLPWLVDVRFLIRDEVSIGWTHELCSLWPPWFSRWKQHPWSCSRAHQSKAFSCKVFFGLALRAWIDFLLPFFGGCKLWCGTLKAWIGIDNQFDFPWKSQKHVRVKNKNSTSGNPSRTQWCHVVSSSTVTCHWRFALVSVASAGMAISLVFGMPVVTWNESVDLQMGFFDPIT